MAAEGTESRRRHTEYAKDGPTGQERSPAKSSSPFIHAPQFLSFVRSFVRSYIRSRRVEGRATAAREEDRAWPRSPAPRSAFI